MFKGKQRFKCVLCFHRFILKDNSWVKKAYQDYTIHKQTYSELEVRYGMGEKTIRKYFDELNNSHSINSEIYLQSKTQCELKFQDKPDVNLVMDTTFFGRDFGVMVFRGNPERKDKYFNLYWKYVRSERIQDYLLGVFNLRLKYNILSFTVDDRTGLIPLLQRRYNFIPIQLCQFHFVKNILKYTGRPFKFKSKYGLKDTPKLELMNLVLKLKNLNQLQFQSELGIYLENNLSFIQHRAIRSNKYLHRGIRSALSNIKRNLKYIFAYDNNKELNIPKTTNSDEGSFGHWKYKIKLHRHLSQSRMKQMIDEILS